MDSDPVLDGLRGLYQDLSALSRNSLPNIERLALELEATVGDFRKLLDKRSKKNESRQAVLSGMQGAYDLVCYLFGLLYPLMLSYSGKITLDGTEYSLNEAFQQDVLQVADALDVDEIQAAAYYIQGQLDSVALDRSPVAVAIINFHEQRAFLLECLRLILHESFEVEREDTQALMQDIVAMTLEIQNGPLRNGSLYFRKCLDSMWDIEKWLVLLSEQVQKAAIVGQSQTSDIIEIIDYQRQSLARQHESLGAIISYLFKGTFTSSEDFRKLIERLKTIDRFDMILVHYLPALMSSITQYGSSEGQGPLREVRSLHQAIRGNKDGTKWALPKLHAAVIILWLAEYTSWYFENGPASPLQGVTPMEELRTLTEVFMGALEDGGLEFVLSICAGTASEGWEVPARNELVSLLLKDATSLAKEPEQLSSYFRTTLMEGLETFTESLIANMPDAIRQLKSDEDLQRLDQMTALRETTNARGLIEPRMHLESLLLIIAFTFDQRDESAQEFWADTDGNLYGFLQWVSKRQTVPRVSAFCEMLCSLSGGPENSLSAHRFLLDEDMSSKFRRPTSMSWDQMFAELELYATRVSERPSLAHSSILRHRKQETAEVDEPESPVMLTCYLRLISHLCKESSQIRQYILQHSTVNLSNTLLTLCAAPIPHHLRAAIFMTLRCLMIRRMAPHGNEMWTLIDQWISGSGISPLSLTKLPVLTSSSLVWNERHAFRRIIESFDQTNAFVELLTTLVSSTSDFTGSQIYLNFPESLGSSYRMPGIEPYIDFVMGQALASKSMGLDCGEARLLQRSCLDFVAVCLESFNENLVFLVNQVSISANTTVSGISVQTYIRIHPFSRVMEWLFNEDVLRALFATAHQEISEVGRASSESVSLGSLVRCIEVMNMILVHQATFFDIVRPFLRSLPQQGSSNMASASLASFEDSVMDNLGLISDLCLYCGTGQTQLTLAALALLEKLAASRKLNKPTTSFSQWQTSNQIVEVLNTNLEADRIGRSLASQMASNVRELENGPEASGYLIKLGLVQLLDRCLQMITNKPTVAHILLGFQCVGHSLDISPDSLFEKGISLLHAIVDFVKTYPDGSEGTIVSWMVHLKQMALQVLQHLWTSPLASPLVLPQLRGSRLLANLFVTQPVISQESLWDGHKVSTPEFWFSDSAVALSEFLTYRRLVFDYATTEIRAVFKEASPSFQRDILLTVLGNSTFEDGRTICHPSIFDLFDFTDLDLDWVYGFPDLKYFSKVDVNIYSASQGEGFPVLFDLAGVRSLLEVSREQFMNTGQFSSQDEDQLSSEQEKIFIFLRGMNRSRQIGYNRLVALRSWVELAVTILEMCQMEATRMTTLILHTLQAILPKLENSIPDNTEEAFELARLAETLIEKLDSVSADGNEDILDERLHRLFQVCIRGIPSALEGPPLRATLYHICSRYLTRITQKASKSRYSNRAQQIIKSSGSNLIDIICDDSYSGDESCRVSALILLNLVSVLSEQQSSSVVVTCISQANYFSMFLDIIRSMASEFRNAPSSETSQLLVFYEAQLSLLQQLALSKAGAVQLLNAGLFQAVQESRLFAADPDIGLDIDNPDALRKYYDLLLSVLRVIVSAVFTRGLHNKSIVEQTRSFLSDNRQSMIGIFKRSGKVGGLDGAGSQESLGELVKSYAALIAAVDFLDMQNSGTHGNRKLTGKRKLLDGQSDLSDEVVGSSPGTIPDLFSRGRNNSPSHKNRPLSPTNKRLKRNEPGDEQTASLGQPIQTCIPVERMYSFSNSNVMNTSITGQSSLSSSANASRTYLNPSSAPTNFTPHTGPKRLTIKNLRITPKLDQDEYFDKVWTQLDTSLGSIFNDQKPPYSLEELYKGAENLCRQKRSEDLAKKLQERCKQYIQCHVLPLLLTKAKETDDIDVLRMVEEAWSVWSTRLVTIRSIFYYLDQSFLLRSTENSTVYEMGMIGFRSVIFADDSIKSATLRGVCQLVDLDRDNNPSFDSTLLKEAIKLFYDIKLYSSELEPAILKASEQYMKSWSSNEATRSYLATYIDKSHMLIKSEMKRCDKFDFNAGTKLRLSELLDKYLVTEKTGILLEQRDVLGLFRTNNQISLKQLYLLLSRLGFGSRLKSAFSTFIDDEGSSIIFDKEREAEMVARLLEFKQNLDGFLSDCFFGDEILGRTLRETFETFINKNNKGTGSAQPGEMIAKHVDLLLRGGLKAIQKRDNTLKADGDVTMVDDDIELNKALDHVLDLFRFVHGKAVFEAFYKNDLARRLLMGRSASDDAEKSMLARLKSECGSNFTHNLESMFKDIDLARDEMVSYNALQREKRVKTRLDLNVNVLSSAAWPSYPDIPLKIPQMISDALFDFENFYHNKYNGRKLIWKHSLAHCQLKSTFAAGNKEIIVSSFQAVVLLLFNDVPDGQTLSYSDIQNETGLPAVELKRTLQSLACAKYRVLTKHPKGKEINSADIFSFNSKFSDPKMRIKINQIQLKETKEENIETHERVAADRNYETQAAIVRIMKSHKTITPQELIVEVIKATKNRGDLDPADIKKNIDKLIEKEYLERDTESNKYRYLA
ncbi:hypothetical protein LOZ64_005925 [Ophidiomyces ophidiicola]|nr:hypothetical protein LOZ64_005925 [Ophidiomyces ophidiicola]KAI2001552.1 hypothetical protein LOZ50_005609 [Ophidiomyces ophidiicola]KAI2033640.1 hypothetical protein LOZ47_005359 [Ophidiomyces ophidiicola]KAI2042051.1 hypothetical protein LOZ44_006426 [Ophidiomyces ophidiicola]KAI2062404.1 hypothetical protein LOZ40_005887 [Ophidiomyces ophidiicola]